MANTTSFKLIIEDNERAVADYLDRGDYLQAVLFIHTLLESLLRLFLNETGKEIRFNTLIKRYEHFLESQNHPKTLVDELDKFNKRRNRIVHELWRKGYSYTNHQSKEIAFGAVNLYSLTVEFIETWNSEITEFGFEIDT